MTGDKKDTLRKLLMDTSIEIGMLLDAAEYVPSPRQFIENRRQRYEDLKSALWNEAKEL